MTYYCATCKETVDSRICPICGEPAEPFERRQQEEDPTGEAVAFEEPLSRLLRSTGPETGSEGPLAAEDRSTVREENPPARLSAPAALPEAGPEIVRRRSEDQGAHAPIHRRAVIVEAALGDLKHYVEEGYEIYLVAGIYQVGKSQLLDAFRQGGYLSALENKKREGRVLRTAPGTLQCFTFSVDGRRVAFVDAAGESFTQLYPYALEGGDEAQEIGPEDISFLRLLSDNLRGVALLLDLQTLWHPDLQKRRVDYSKQQEILAWILLLLRWLRLDGFYEPGALTFRQHVDSRAKTLRERLDVPVLVLFTKADELFGLSIGGRASTEWMSKGRGRDGRKLSPLGETPLLLARHRLTELYGAVRAHARNFRFDFVHSVVSDRDAGVIIEDDPPCGVDYSLGWLLDPAWSRRYSRPLPSRFWIDFQERLDKLTGRGERWRRLPEPEDFL